MPPRLLSASLDEAALRRVLSAYNNLLTLVYLESETRVVLAPLVDFLGPKITLPPVPWLVGRAFGPTLEIRWHTEGDQFEALSLTESGAGPDDWQASPWTPLLDPVTRERYVLLAGVNSTALPSDHTLYNAQPDGGLWVDTRIARPLNYPAPDPKAERVTLRCIDYCSRGIVVISRLAALASYDG
jgi:hypothetical protein